MITEEFGKHLKELRSKVGISQEKFALKIGMDRTYYASVENGRRNIALKNIKKSLMDLKFLLVNYSMALVYLMEERRIYKWHHILITRKLEFRLK